MLRGIDATYNGLSPQIRIFWNDNGNPGRGRRMPVLTAGKLRALSASVFLTVMFAAPGFAQDDEELPTLKLDRIPASPEFSGQTRARAASRSNFRV